MRELRGDTGGTGCQVGGGRGGPREGDESRRTPEAAAELGAQHAAGWDGADVIVRK